MWRRAERPAAVGAFDAPLLGFLRQARRRYLTRELLGAALAGAVASFLLGLAVVWVNRLFSLDLPGLAIAIALFVIFGAASLRRNRIDRVAVRADRGLRLQDRLVTFLDFRARPDMDRDFRQAQAREAATALSRADLSRGIPIPRLLWAAPLLFGWMLYQEYFPFFTPFTQPFRYEAVQVVDPHRVDRVVHPPDAGTAEKHEGEAVSPPPEARPAAAPGAAPPAEQGGKKPPAEDRAGNHGAPGSSPLASVPAIIPEPARLYSEPVGKSLTPVADATPGTAAPAPPEPPLRGRISFNLVPVDGKAPGPSGEGTKPGSGKADGLGITIDYDDVPPEFRSYVRRYFNALARLFQGGSDGT